MSKIAIEEMSYYYADYYFPVFERVSLTIDTDWKTGLIGRNGRGKTTLLKLLSGELEPSSGYLYHTVPLSYFPYDCNQKYKKTMDVIKENIGGLKTMELTMEDIINKNDTNRMELYFELLQQYQNMRGYEMDSLIQKEIEFMQLDPSLLEQDFSTLSGGEKTSIMILSLFLRKDAFILLDEPTNHLDLQRKEALTNYLKHKKGFIVVSHEVGFLDQVVDHIIAINKADISLEQGNYSTWKKNMLIKEQYDLRTRQRLEQEIGQLSRNSKKTRAWSNVGNQQKYEFACHARTNGTRAYMRQAKRAEQHIKDNLEEKKTLLRNLEEEKELSVLQTSLDSSLIEVTDLNFSYCSGKKKRPLFHHFDFHITTGERIWLRGKNGVGKSTFLKLLQGELESENIWYVENLVMESTSQEPRWNRGDIRELFFKQYGEEEKTERRFEKFMELCDAFDIPSDFTKRPLETLSSGELKKVDIARGLSGENHLLLMDEPLNYMDTMFREQLMKALLKDEVTVIFVEHDKTFGEKVATRIVDL